MCWRLNGWADVDCSHITFGIGSVNAVSAMGLGLIHRGIRLLEHICVVTVSGIETGIAHARGDLDPAAL